MSKLNFNWFNQNMQELHRVLNIVHDYGSPDMNQDWVNVFAAMNQLHTALEVVTHDGKVDPWYLTTIHIRGNSKDPGTGVSALLETLRQYPNLFWHKEDAIIRKYTEYPIDVTLCCIWAGDLQPLLDFAQAPEKVIQSEFLQDLKVEVETYK